MIGRLTFGTAPRAFARLTSMPVPKHVGQEGGATVVRSVVAGACALLTTRNLLLLGFSEGFINAFSISMRDYSIVAENLISLARWGLLFLQERT